MICRINSHLDPLRAAVTPLGVDLPADRRRQDGCGNPADQLGCHRVGVAGNVSARCVPERVGHHIYFHELAIRNASQLLRGRTVHDPNTEVDGAPALSMNCSAVICAASRGCSNAPGSFIMA
jgi:hypothetical protein